MRDNVDVWPQALWVTAPLPARREPARPTPWTAGAIIRVAVALALLGTVLVLALVAPSAGAAGGCGGG